MPAHVSCLLAGSLLVASTAAIAGGRSEGGGPGGPALVAMPELVVPIVEGARAGGRLRLKLVLRATDAAAAARLQAAMPSLREASLLATAEFARLYASPFAPVDARRLADEVGGALRARDGGIAQVLVVEVSAARA